MKRIIYQILTLAIICLPFINSCELINTEEPVPSYIYIDTIVLNTQTFQGSGAHGITEAWVSVGSQLVGAFPLPALIPVLETGDQNVTIFGGMIQNGVAELREIYPLYKRYTATINLQSGEVDTLRPTITYTDNAIFPLVEDFETTNLISEDLDQDLDTKVITTSFNVFEGNKSGQITLSDTSSFIEVGSNLFYEIEELTAMYLELHYKSDITFEIGLIGQSNLYYEKFYKVGLLSTDGEWRKAYIDFTNDFQAMSANTAREFKIAFRAIKLESNPNPSNIYLDNIKLIYQ